MKKGTRLYRCFDCGEKTQVHWVERNRAARVRCSACGSLSIDPVTDDAKNEIIDTNMNKLEGAHGSVTVSNADYKEISGRKVVR